MSNDYILDAIGMAMEFRIDNELEKRSYVSKSGSVFGSVTTKSKRISKKKNQKIIKTSENQIDLSLSIHFFGKDQSEDSDYDDKKSLLGENEKEDQKAPLVTQPKDFVSDPSLFLSFSLNSKKASNEEQPKGSVADSNTGSSSDHTENQVSFTCSKGNRDSFMSHAYHRVDFKKKKISKIVYLRCKDEEGKDIHFDRIFEAKRKNESRMYYIRKMGCRTFLSIGLIGEKVVRVTGIHETSVINHPMQDNAPDMSKTIFKNNLAIYFEDEDDGMPMDK